MTKSPCPTCGAEPHWTKEALAKREPGPQWPPPAVTMARTIHIRSLNASGYLHEIDAYNVMYAALKSVTGKTG